MVENTEKQPHISPLRCAPVEMTIRLGSAKSRFKDGLPLGNPKSRLEMHCLLGTLSFVPKMNCHLDRSAAEWRDLQSCGFSHTLFSVCHELAFLAGFTIAAAKEVAKKILNEGHGFSR
jgi:hypothetical protein